MKHEPKGRRGHEDAISKQGFLTTLAPFLVLVLLLLDAPGSIVGGSRDLPFLALLLSMGAAGLLFLGGWVLPTRPRCGRALSLFSLCVFTLGVVPGLIDDPGLALAALVGLGFVAFWITGFLARREVPHDDVRGPASASAMRVGVLTSSGLVWAAWLMVVGERAGDHPVAQATCLGVCLSATIHAVRWSLASLREEPRRRGWFFLAPYLCALPALLAWRNPSVALSLLALQQVLVLALLIANWHNAMDWWLPMAEQPARLLAGTFALVSLVGATLLTFPISSSDGEGHPFLDALFTSVSATCVTGLGVLDTPTDFSHFGQFVILGLIQVGGLGIMTFSAAFTLALGGRLGLRQESALAEIMSGQVGGALREVLRRILVVTFTLEGLGTLMLGTLFAIDGDPPSLALWRGLFTSVSAFCNAGFALQSDSLAPWRENGLVLHTVAALILLGGLGTGVIIALPQLLNRRAGLVEPRLVVTTSLVLLLFSACLFTAFEWNGSLGGLAWWQRLNNAWFHAVTPRTAGFNSVDVSALGTPALVLTLGLMFIGGSPGSTAGGIKTTTFALLALTTLASLRGHNVVRVFGRSIGSRSIHRALAVAFVGLGMISVGFVALALTQDLPFTETLFEAVSALGTVGLSMGATTRLDAVGKTLVILLMYVGRIGPLTLFLLFTDRESRDRWEYPEEQVTVG